MRTTSARTSFVSRAVFIRIVWARSKIIYDAARARVRFQRRAQTICSKSSRFANPFPKLRGLLFFDGSQRETHRDLKFYRPDSDSCRSGKMPYSALNRKRIAYLPGFGQRPEKDSDRVRNCPRQS